MVQMMKPNLMINVLPVLAAMLVCQAARAQEPAAEQWSGPILTESEAVSAALANSEELLRLEKKVSARQRDVDRAPFDVSNPELRLQDISTRYADTSANHRFQIGLRWRLPRFGEVDENVAAARWEYWDARVDAFKYRSRLAGDVRMAWVDVVYLNRELGIASRREETAVRQVDVINRLVELGDAPFVKKVKAQTALIRARRDVAAARQALAAGRVRLAGLTGNDLPVDTGSYDVPSGDLSLTGLMELARVTRPEVECEGQRAELARSERRSNRLRLIPSFSFVEAVYHYEKTDADWGELMLGIELPVFDWGMGRRIEVEDGGGRETRSYSSMEEIGEGIGQAFSKWSRARGAWTVLRDQAAAAGEGVRNTIVEARSRAVPESDVIELEMSVLDLEDMLVAAERDYAEATVELCASVGTDDCSTLFLN